MFVWGRMARRHGDWQGRVAVLGRGPHMPPQSCWLPGQGLAWPRVPLDQQGVPVPLGVTIQPEEPRPPSHVGLDSILNLP